MFAAAETNVANLLTTVQDTWSSVLPVGVGILAVLLVVPFAVKGLKKLIGR